MAQKPSKPQQARDHKAKNPNVTLQEIADALKISYNAVQQALKKAGGTKKKGKRGPKTKAAVAAAVPAHVSHVGTMLRWSVTGKTVETHFDGNKRPASRR